MPYAIDLFCGAGGCSEGLIQAGFHILFSSDISDMVEKTYVHRHEQLGLIQGKNTWFERADIRNLTGDIIRERITSLEIFKGKEMPDIDLMIGGPSCQGFSRAGRRDVNDPRNIAKNKRMMSINTAMSVDVFGQVAAESIGWSQQSAVGGQIDFVKGAQWSEGGKSIIALASSFEKNGQRQSKICLNFPAGTAVTTPRSEVQYVATEYGCVNLKKLNMSDRVRAMISLAHPDFRDQLRDEAREHGLI